jgi:hypothetical protein
MNTGYFAYNDYLCNQNKHIRKMNLLNFTAQFPDEASCRDKWKEYREQEGVVCPMKKAIFVCLLWFACLVAAYSQMTYPVYVQTLLIPPYTPHIPAYYTGLQEKMRVTLINLDAQQPLLRVYLRMRIVSSAFSLVNPPEAYTPTIELPSGLSVTLSRDDLAPYFSRNNLRTSGLLSDFNRTQLLPDNFYRFNFDVYEATTHRLLSNPNMGFAMAMIAAGDPPVLNLPEKGAKIKESAIPSIFFSWTPRHMNSPAVAYNTEYEFTLVEIYDKHAPPESAFMYSRPLYTERVRSTSFIHTAAQPMLLPWMRYAWRVRAVAREGIDDVSIFKNDGYSPIFYFDYVSDCNTVQICGAVYERGCVNITWNDVGVMEYTVEYRRKDSEKWYTSRNVAPGMCEIYNLRYGVEYEYRIGTRCMINDDFVYNDIKSFRIPDSEERQPNCGILPDVSLSNRTPATELPPDKPVKAGDFPVFITKVSGTGTFSGEGYVRIPYLRNAQVAVTFSNIVVNTDNQLLSGFFETKYDAENPNLLLDIDKTLTGGSGVGDIRSGEERAAFDVDYVLDPNIPAKPPVADDGEDPIRDANGNYIFTKGENGKYQLVLTDSEGNEHTLETDEIPFTVTDGNGNTFEIGENGTAKPVSSASDIRLPAEEKETPHPELAVLQFEETANTKFALDPYRDVYAKVTEYFLKYKPTNEDMIASAKFMTPGASDEIFVRILSSGNGFAPEKVHFVTDKGKDYNGVYDEEKRVWTLTLVGGEADDGQHLYAVMETAPGEYATLARLNIYTYTPKSINVKLIPVNGFTNGFTKENVSQELNAIYNRVGINCEVEMTPDFEYEPLTTGEFNVEGSGLFSTLTDDMADLNMAYLQAHPDEEALCLFLIKNVTGAEGVVGDMPRGCQFGYLFEGATAQTIAHEIGHGIFRLDHPFDRANAAKSFDHGDLADNVMEYPPHAGERFVKLQWDAIHAPGLVIGLFETDEDAMRKDESKRSQITRFMYAIKNVIQKNYRMNFTDTEFLRTDDIMVLNSKENYSVKADHVFYGESLSDYFEEVELKLLFDAAKQLSSLPNELSSLSQNAVAYKSWFVKDLDVVIAFVFKQETDISVFTKFLGEKDILTPPQSSTRKAFFVHGTSSDPERWMEHPLTEKILLCIANTDKYDDRFSWQEHNHLTNTIIDRNKAALDLTNYILKNSQGFNEVVLIGHSHGGNVSLQAVNQLVNKGKTVFLITTSTPAYNAETIEIYDRNLQNCEFIGESVKSTVSPSGGINTQTTYVFKNPENPMNTKVKKHLHLWNKDDLVAGPIAGDDYYKSNGITENVEIPAGDEYKDSAVQVKHLIDGNFMDIINLEFINAHGLDSNRPQLIYQMFLNGKIKSIK